MTRPAGVTAAAVLLYISAGLALLGCCGIAVLVGGETGDYGGLLMLVTGLILFSAAINGVLGYFVMEGKQWARIVAIVLCGLGILVTGVQFVVDAEAVGVGGCFGILYNGIIVGLLSAREASEYFQQSG